VATLPLGAPVELEVIFERSALMAEVTNHEAQMTTITESTNRSRGDCGPLLRKTSLCAEKRLQHY